MTWGEIYSKKVSREGIHKGPKYKRESVTRRSSPENEEENGERGGAGEGQKPLLLRTWLEEACAGVECGGQQDKAAP